MYKSRSRYECIECKYETTHNGNFEKHLSTISHKENVYIKNQIGIEAKKIMFDKIEKLTETNRELREKVLVLQQELYEMKNSRHSVNFSKN